MYDVIIIGAGVSGSAVARELSRYRLNVAVIEKETDVCEGTSKSNSAIIHAGFDAKPGTLKAELNVQGNRMMDDLARDLDIPFKRNGSMVVCENEEGIKGLQELYERGIKNGVEELSILSREELLKLEPNLSDKIYAALLAPTGGIVCPFLMTIALAENAAENGVEFILGTEVTGIRKEDASYVLSTNNGEYETGIVINAAGVHADELHNMVSEKKLHITPRTGGYCIFDKNSGNIVSHTIFPLPTAMGKGILVSPTIHGNLFIGPTARDIDDKEDTSTSSEDFRTLFEKGSDTVKGIRMNQVITSFGGLRAHEDGDDFIIKELEDAKGFIDVAGIESPGFSSAPAIGVMVRDIVVSILHPEKNENFVGTRKGFVSFAERSKEEQRKLIEENPAFGRVVCRCETVTEGEIIEAIRRPLGATTLDGVKRRVRAGMGRCQGGFCTPKVMEILARELGIPMSDIRKNGPGSKLICGTDKDRL